MLMLWVGLTYSHAKVAKRGTKANTFAPCRHSDLASYAPAGSSLACKGGHIHALMVAGGLVMQHAPGGDWKRVDWDVLAAWLDRYGYKVADCETETLPTADAASGNARVKTHRR